jgi:hypothetical protein
MHEESPAAWALRKIGGVKTQGAYAYPAGIPD